MRFSIGLPNIVSFRPGGPENRSKGRPVIVTEQRADPVELLYQAFQRLDFDERQRLRWRLARAPR